MLAVLPDSFVQTGTISKLR